MAKPQSNFRNMVIALLGVTLVASASLGLVYDATKAPIAKAEMDKQTNAIAAVLPAFDKLGDTYKMLPTDGKDSIEIFPALDANNTEVGKAVKTYTYKGFSGYIEIMVGFDKQGSITGFKVLKHAETPGLGSKMDEWFSNTEKETQNIIGLKPGNTGLKVTKDGGNIDAITAATISSRAFLDAINRANATANSQYIDGSSSATKKEKHNE